MIMRTKRKRYTISLNPTVIESLDAYIIKEKKHAFKEEHTKFLLQYWDRNFFIECAIKQLIES